jgi:CubicO group peptidase (beta-lactamase class C family)
VMPNNARASLLTLVFLLSLCGAGMAQKPSNPLAPGPNKNIAPAPPAAPQVPPAQLTTEDVSAFLDGVVPLQIERNDIAGAVVVVVKGGNVLFAKGYGYADREKKKPVSAGDTLFRVGSISKLFTWTAVMQLVEAGKLDLDRNVNDYLDFKIPTTYPESITLRHLMTHTPGFEETIRELFVANAQQMTPLGHYLRTHMPVRIFPPGKVPAYSNYGASLAGYIVQRVSGEKFEDYVRDHIFQPLEMTHSSFVQPLPADLQPMMSQGYDLGSGKPKGFEFVVPAPAGALATSGLDISRFMIAQLQNGKFGSLEKGYAQILQPQTVALMHSRQFGLSPDLNGMALGFYEETRNGHRIIGHGGDTMWFHSDLHLMLDQDLGFFISGNSAGKPGVSLRTAVWEKFLDRYFPYQPPAPAPPPTKQADVQKVRGNYLTSRREQTNFLFLGELLGEMTVTTHPDGTIENGSKAFNGQPKKFEEIAPLVYREVDGQDTVAFVRGINGGLTVAVNFPAVAYQSIPWYEHKNFVLFLLIGAVSVFALSLIFWIVAALVRHHYQRRLDWGAGDRFLRTLTRSVCILDLAAYGVWAGVLLYGTADITRLNSGLDPWIHLAEALTILGVVATVFPLVNAVRGWMLDRWWWSKIWETLIALACLAFVWLAVLGKLWTWTVKY